MGKCAPGKMRAAMVSAKMSAAKMRTSEMAAARVAATKMSSPEMTAAEVAATMAASAVAAATTMAATTMPATAAASAERRTRQCGREQQNDNCNAGFRHGSSLYPRPHRRVAPADTENFCLRQRSRHAVRLGPIASNWAFCSSLSVP